jgi:hypothetical protein
MRTMGLMELWKYGVRSFLQKSGTILYFPFCVDSFVIGFAIIEIPSVLISKKKAGLHIVWLVSWLSEQSWSSRGLEGRCGLSILWWKLTLCPEWKRAIWWPLERRLSNPFVCFHSTELATGHWISEVTHGRFQIHRIKRKWEEGVAMQWRCEVGSKVITATGRGVHLYLISVKHVMLPLIDPMVDGICICMWVHYFPYKSYVSSNTWLYVSLSLLADDYTNNIFYDGIPCILR